MRSARWNQDERDTVTLVTDVSAEVAGSNSQSAAETVSAFDCCSMKIIKFVSSPELGDA
jgi:hypothetical protein